MLQSFVCSKSDLNVAASSATAFTSLLIRPRAPRVFFSHVPHQLVNINRILFCNVTREKEKMSNDRAYDVTAALIIPSPSPEIDWTGQIYISNYIKRGEKNEQIIALCKRTTKSLVLLFFFQCVVELFSQQLIDVSGTQT